MYLAELHGKLSSRNENKEDILTSNVFSFFKYADRKIFLYHFLKSLDLQITPDDALDAEFNFWPHYEDGTEPDLVIIAGDYYLLFEAKYFSGFSEATNRIEHQIVREIEGGQYEAKSLHKQFRFIAITAHYYFTPSIFYGLHRKYLKQVSWINWQKIALTVYKAIEDYSNISLETRLFAQDFYDLLLRKNLRTYSGPEVLSSMPKIQVHPDEIFFNAVDATYRGDFFGFIESLGTIARIPSPRTDLFYNSDTFFFDNLLLETGRIKETPEQLFFGVHHGKTSTN